MCVRRALTRLGCRFRSKKKIVWNWAHTHNLNNKMNSNLIFGFFFGTFLSGQIDLWNLLKQAAGIAGFTQNHWNVRHMLDRPGKITIAVSPGRPWVLFFKNTKTARISPFSVVKAGISDIRLPKKKKKIISNLYSNGKPANCHHNHFAARRMRANERDGRNIILTNLPN